MLPFVFTIKNDDNYKVPKYNKQLIQRLSNLDLYRDFLIWIGVYNFVLLK